MAAYHKCCFMGCATSKALNPPLHFYSFPTSRPQICQQWIVNCANESIISLPDKTLKKRVVCEKHFTNDSFLYGIKRRLVKNAIPTILSVHDDVTSLTPEQELSAINDNSRPSPKMIPLMKHKRCFVLGCKSSEVKNTNEVFFNFPPRNAKEFTKWLAFAQNPNLCAKGKYSLLSKRWICGKHFHTDSFKTSERRNLLHGAVPTLYPPDCGEPVLPDHQYSLSMPPTMIPFTVQAPPAPQSPTSLPLDFQELDTNLVEVLNEEQAEKRINKLMDDLDTLTQENIILKKENTKLRIGYDVFKQEICRWQACAQGVIKKASQNSCDDYVRYMKENGNLCAQLRSMSEKLEAAKKEKIQLEEQIHLLTQQMVFQEVSVSSDAVKNATTEKQLNHNLKTPGNEDPEHLYELNDIITDWVVDEEVELT